MEHTLLVHDARSKPYQPKMSKVYGATLTDLWRSARERLHDVRLEARRREMAAVRNATQAWTMFGTSAISTVAALTTYGQQPSLSYAFAIAAGVSGITSIILNYAGEANANAARHHRDNVRIARIYIVRHRLSSMDDKALVAAEREQRHFAFGDVPRGQAWSYHDYVRSGAVSPQPHRRELKIGQ